MRIFGLLEKRKADRVEVHVNRLSGIYSTTMKIGKDISQHTVERYKDPESGVLYVYVMLVQGQEHRYLCKNKDAWLAATARIDEQVRLVNEEFLASLPEDERPELLKKKFLLRIPGRRKYSRSGRNWASRSLAQSGNAANSRSHFE
jgi:hypothetical protein